MPEDLMIPAGHYKVRKRFRQEEVTRKKRDIPWQKRVLDLDNRQVFGRTAWAWFRIVGFYLLLYFLIMLLMGTWLVIFNYALIPKGRPKWLKGPPGFSVVPGNTTTISWYTHLEKQIHPIADTIEAALDNLNDDAEKFFEECNRDTVWGYGEAKTPCFFVKMNKVYGFMPKTYDSVDDLPSDAPDELTDVLGKYGGKSRVWLTCKADNDGPSPTMVFIPGPYYDAAINMEGVTRMVGVKLTEMPYNKEVQITCKAWAKNIDVNEKISGKGHVKITLRMRVDEKEQALSPSSRRVTIRRRVLRPPSTRSMVRKKQKATTPISTSSQTASPTESPTENPTASPTENPTASSTKSSKKSPKKQDDQGEQNDDDDEDVEEENAKETTVPTISTGKKRKQSPKEKDDQGEQNADDDDDDVEEENAKESTIPTIPTEKKREQKLTETPNGNTVTAVSPKENTVTKASPKITTVAVTESFKEEDDSEDTEDTDEEDEDDDDDEEQAKPKSPKVQKATESPKKPTVTESPKTKKVTESPKEEEDAEDQEDDEDDEVEEDEADTTVPTTRKSITTKATISRQMKMMENPKKQKMMTESPKPKKVTEPQKNQKAKTKKETSVHSTRKPKTHRVTERIKMMKGTARATPKEQKRMTQPPKTTTEDQVDEDDKPLIEDDGPETTEFDPYFEDL